MHGNPAVCGTFTDRKSATKAVHRLAEESVPADVIRVFVLDAGGDVIREVPVDDESGVLKGALIGAGIGAVGAFLLGALALAGLALAGIANPVGIETIPSALGVIMTGAIVGLPIGGILGMGRWSGARRISAAEASAGEIRVVVTSQELAGKARRTLEASGATSVWEEDGTAQA